MNKFFYPRILLRKSKSLIERLATMLEVWENQSSLHAFRLSYAERVFLCQFRPFITRTKNPVIYDIGAHIGSFSSAMAQMDNIREIYAFEPLTINYEQLLNRTRNFEKVHCFNVALGQTNQHATFYQSEFEAASSMLPMTELHKTQFPYSANVSLTEVQVVNLDQFVENNNLEPPNIVKIDVQGFEGHVVRGGRQTIMNASYCMVELNFQGLYEDSILFDEMYELMRSMDFEFVGAIDFLKDRDGNLLQMDGVFQNGKADFV